MEALKRLRDLGNSVIVVEHDEEAMLTSDYIIDIGPQAGINGGEVIAKGTCEEIKLSIKEANKWFIDLPKILDNKQNEIAEHVLKEINERLKFLVNVGLDYLNLSRSSGTLSGGESQRIRLASQIGSGLQGVLYVLDEPSIGLHQKDNSKLLEALKRLRDLGNSVIVVEHDGEAMLTSCLLYTSPSPRDGLLSRMPSSA